MDPTVVVKTDECQVDILEKELVWSTDFCRTRSAPDSAVKKDGHTIEGNVVNIDEAGPPTQEVVKGDTESSTATEEKEDAPKPNLFRELR